MQPGRRSDVVYKTMQAPRRVRSLVQSDVLECASKMNFDAQNYIIRQRKHRKSITFEQMIDMT